MEAHLYDGIKEVLKYLSQDSNKKIFITTSKNEPIALEMCQHLGITEYFDGIYGALVPFTRLMSCSVPFLENEAPKDQSVIVGDTKYRLDWRKTVGIKDNRGNLGIWEKRNPLGRNPDFVADTVQELWDILK